MRSSTFTFGKSVFRHTVFDLVCNFCCGRQDRNTFSVWFCFEPHFLFYGCVDMKSRFIKTVEVPDYVKITMPPAVEKVDLYKDQIVFGEGREVYFEDYLMPCLIVMDFNKPVAKISLLRKENSHAKLDYEIHFCAKNGKKEEARSFAFDLYTDIQKIFYKNKRNITLEK